MSDELKTPEQIEGAITDGLAAVAEIKGGAPEQRARWCRIGLGLRAGRVRYPNDRDFRAWLQSTAYSELARNLRQDAMWLSLNAERVLPLFAASSVTSATRIRRMVAQHHPSVLAQCRDIRDEIIQGGQEREVTHPCVTSLLSDDPNWRTSKKQEAIEARAEAARQMLRQDPAQTNIHIARTVGVAQAGVADLRRELQEAGAIPVLERRNARPSVRNKDMDVRELAELRQTRAGAKAVRLPKAAISERAKAAMRGQTDPNSPFAKPLRGLTRDEVDPTFDQELREEIGREPTKEELAHAWTRKHGHVQIRTWQEREKEERERIATTWFGALINGARELAPLRDLVQNPKLRDVLDDVRASSGTSARRLTKAREAFATLIEIVESLEPFFAEEQPQREARILHS